MAKSAVKYSAFKFTALKYKGSVLGHVFPKVIFFLVWTLGIILINRYGATIAINTSLVGLLTLVISLLLVFRTNTAYDRYWEGRRLWSSMTVAIRSITRNIWIHVDCDTAKDKVAKEKAINLLIAYSYAVKHYLREEYGYEFSDLRTLIDHIPRFSTPSSLDPIVEDLPFRVNEPGSPLVFVEKDEGTILSNNLPIEIAFCISTYVAEVAGKNQIPPPVNSVLIANINSLIDALSGFERILGSPIPTAYSVHLSQITWLFCLALPFQMLSLFKKGAERDWIVLPVVLITVYTVFGIINIGEEIENPFGFDANDLPLDEYCTILEDEIKSMVKRPPPSVASWVGKSGPIQQPGAELGGANGEAIGAGGAVGGGGDGGGGGGGD